METVKQWIKDIELKCEFWHTEIWRRQTNLQNTAFLDQEFMVSLEKEDTACAPCNFITTVKHVL